ncbi:hypothetical protein MHUMG1_05973 [Metarhizium humberi]|uniref:Uncharacterized protein n=1 Tax=Metarhizium humberi TaxID=2596975 RepID=A0A9P8M9S2_9HYPO|nr:hypothetical protein MHUMG1_05973 [Metarhizium humberi]
MCFRILSHALCLAIYDGPSRQDIAVKAVAGPVGSEGRSVARTDRRVPGAEDAESCATVTARNQLGKTEETRRKQRPGNFECSPGRPGLYRCVLATQPVAAYPPLLLDDLWPGEVGHDTFGDLMTPLSPASDDNLDIGLVGFLPLTKPGHLGIETSENDIYLLVNFMEDSFTRQYSLHQAAPSKTQKSWLLALMLRSPTFYNTSLSMSAYHLHLSKSCDANARETALRSYQRYREMALQSFERLESTASSTQREMIICGVHIARLEALGKNIRSCQSYFGRVTQVILEQGCLFHAGLACHLGQPKEAPTHYTTPELSPWCAELALSAPIPQPSRMELEAEALFVSVFIWNDILCSAVEKKMACAAGMHRKLLTDDGFSSAFQAITGCEAWAMVAIMDITSLEIQKSEQEAQGNLSIRGLVSQADTIEGAVDREMARISNMMLPKSPDEPQDKAVVPHDLIQTLIYGHAILIFLNTVVSGALTGVPEINQSIGRAMQAWDMLPATANPRYLAWAYAPAPASHQAPSETSFAMWWLACHMLTSTRAVFASSATG